MKCTKTLFCVLSLVVFTMTASSQQTHTQLMKTAFMWEKAEFQIQKVPAVDNPFDPDQITLDARITTPSGVQYQVPAFWMQPQLRTKLDGREIITPSGTAEWRLRFTPNETGKHKIELLTTINGKPYGETEFTSFEVLPMPEQRKEDNRHGFVRLSADQRSFQTDDGRLLKLIGENVCWPEGNGSYDYDKWLQAMAASGQNFFRIWMAPWHLPFEHLPNTLNRYPQDAAFQLDSLFQRAGDLKMYLMISFDHHGMYQLNDPTWGGSNAFWDSSNPYSTSNGGPCEKPNDFFTSSDAKHIYQKRLRYLVARYGYSTQLLNWQFFNEIDNAFDRAPLNPQDVYDWHAEMANWFAKNDPYDHLVTTSLTGDSDRAEIWQIPEIDYSMFHSYWDPAPARFNAQLAESFIKTYQKPYMIGEYGTNAFNLNVDGDPHMRGFRQALWGGVMGGSVGTSMSWWWEDIHRQNLYPIYKTLHDVLTEAGWEEGNWTPNQLLQPPQPTRLAAPLQGALPFNAVLATTPNNRMNLSGKVAIANELAAKRSAEFLQSFLKPANSAPGKHEQNLLDKLRKISSHEVSFDIEAIFSTDAKLVININGVEKDTQLHITIDQDLVLTENLTDTDGAIRHSNELNQSIEIPIPAGNHRIRLLNTGDGWIEFNRIQLNQVQPSAFENNWTYEPEALALGNLNEGKAVLYIVSPHIVYPCGAKDFNPPEQRNKSLMIQNMPLGTYQVKWFDPVSDECIATESVSCEEHQLHLQFPVFNEDLIAYVKLN